MDVCLEFTSREYGSIARASARRRRANEFLAASLSRCACARPKQPRLVSWSSRVNRATGGAKEVGEVILILGEGQIEKTDETLLFADGGVSAFETQAREVTQLLTWSSRWRTLSREFRAAPGR